MNSTDLNVDLNVIKILLGLIAFLIGIVGYFVKKEISNFGKRIDNHDGILFKLAGEVQRLIGYYEASKRASVEDRRVEDRPPSSGTERRRRVNLRD